MMNNSIHNKYVTLDLTVGKDVNLQLDILYKQKKYILYKMKSGVSRGDFNRLNFLLDAVDVAMSFVSESFN